MGEGQGLDLTRDDLLHALQDNNVQAFLRVIRAGESSQDDSAYTVRFGGSHFAAPPWAFPDGAITIGSLTSTASGAYQFLRKTWAAIAARYGFPDFSPQCQDEGAVALIAGRGALQLVMEGRIREAISRCALEWASLPGSPYGQPTRSIEQAIATYLEHGGTLAETKAAETPERKDMLPLPLIVAGIDALREFIPAISSIFKPGSEVAARNVQAAQVIFDTVSRATGQPNVQAAIEQMQSDPAAIAAAKEAVHEVLPQLIEAGGGGIDGARKASAAPDALPFWKQPAFWFLSMTLPLVYMLAVSVLFGVGGVDWATEVRVMVATGLIALLSSGCAFYWGSSFSSQRKDATIAAGKP